MLDLSVLLLGLTLILYGLYKYITINNDYFEKKRIPYMKPTFIFGNTGALYRKKYTAYEFVMLFYNAMPKHKIFGLFEFKKPFFYIRDPEIVKQLAVKDFDSFSDHRPFITEKSDKMFGNSLFMLRGEKWRDMRTTLSPAFTGSKMRQMFELVSDCADDVAKHYIAKAANGEKINCEMKDFFSRYANDVIASAAFGLKVNSFKDTENEFFKAGKSFSNINNKSAMIKLFFIQIVPSIMRVLDIEFIDKKVGKFCRSMVIDTMKIREDKGIFRPDMINIMMQIKKGNSNLLQEQQEDNTTDGFATVEEVSNWKMNKNRLWNMDEIVAQCFVFFVAGFETSSTVISFVSYELAVNPDIQQKLFEEVFATHNKLNGKQINYDSLQRMKYMDMVISEVLRKWPPASLTDRFCIKDYVYDDGNNKFTIEKGTPIWIPIYGFHRDPKYFPNPDEFDPERFNDDNKGNIIPGTYIPFGVGPRNCIGSRFALMEVKAIIYYLLLHFEFVPNQNTQIPVKLGKTLFSVTSEKGIHLELKSRKVF